MNNKSSIVYNKLQRGFSLVEVMIAIAILTVALVMVGTSFPVGVAMTTNVAERTIAVVAADQAFAMVRLYGINTDAAAWNTPPVTIGLETVRQQWLPFEDVIGSALPADQNEVFAYPCDRNLIRNGESFYYWSALCKRELDSSGNPTGNVMVVVFVSRKVGGENIKHPLYFEREGEDLAAVPPVTLNDWPKPILLFDERSGVLGFNPGDGSIIRKLGTAGKNVRLVNKTPIDPGKQRAYLQTGSFVLDDDTGGIYRVVERKDDTPAYVMLDRDFEPVDARSNYKFWVVPPGIGTSRNPCIAVYQKVIKF